MLEAVARLRISALLLIVALSANPLVLCVGWPATPEARMACCSNVEPCPMHPSHPHAVRAHTQAQADSCCAASEDRNPGPSTSTFVLLVSRGLVAAPVSLALQTPARRLEPWRTLAPAPGTHIPRHLLHSVFLV